MNRYEVTSATADGFDPDHRIDMIGGPDFGGWRMLQDDAIAFLKRRQGAFYVRPRPMTGFGFTLAGYENALTGSLDREVDVVVRGNSLLAREHLTTVADGTQKNNLCSLPPCPQAYQLVSELP
ncbi:DUF3892 domain-containing protein [Phenylobacterium sp.]|uniref:DUF3892 domain-containing protein n=1 Tax=Phenylobacterium sp. TaxID=1871053 RepID=UPI0027306465|nr:DUF3892 domain-containing protein [Phenylobacterium sp.]MDP1615787.1 DUF3892 domain-containing protein [Phenylobacterium sp.]MDP1989202.1 DUF3892 domain-containing protein [Phenylobacterium sp.]